MPGQTASPSSVPFGVYVHVPFCRARCDYCAFATWTDRDHLIGDYVAALHDELALRRERGTIRPATSVFFGGGTPSRIPAAALCGVLEAIERVEGAEVTVECNPEDADPARLDTYRRAGVTRLSLGIQSTSGRVLRSLGRRHGTGALHDVAVAVGHVGFESWNVDLIFGDRAERPVDLERTLDDVLGLDSPPPHVSAYALTPEPGTPLGEDRTRHPDDDVLASRYDLVDRRLTEAGYAWEEISNWARPGHEARHNWLYWTEGEYAGVGCAAHSHLGATRSWNLRTPQRYCDALARGELPTAGEEALDASTRGFEALTLLLRTRLGVPLGSFDDVESLDDLVEVRGDRVVLTQRGRLLANQVSARLSDGACEARQ
jgi:oxygen-independent coproporphyrinogen-3 oxidase